ncbi:vacuolar iron transporter homolog 3-like [Diospyros lotus]|uniref:vacuolar iron transporter homolog 3-like n=1 Tax=Diospyros lotus TaxID=55363 RepID=UPI0022546A6D|nr:vacuolar iron transporter homolog 3-like [Diospyros lotus]
MAGNQDDGDGGLPNPYKAAAASALAFLAGSIVPFPPAMLIAHNESRMVAIVAVTTVALAVFGAVGAYAGGSPVRVSAVRVLLGGWASMAIAYGLLKALDKDHAEDHEA